MRDLAHVLAGGCLMMAGLFPARLEAADPFLIPVDDALLERKIDKVRGLEGWPVLVDSKSEDAVHLHRQGMVFLYAYQWIDAARSFHAALAADPQCALARLGLARSLEGLGRFQQAHQEVQRSAQVAARKQTEPQALMRIALAQQRYSALLTPGPEGRQRFTAYQSAARLFPTRFPKDPDSWILAALAEEPGPWGRGQNGSHQAMQHYLRALEMEPRHVGAAHFLVHTFENLGEFSQAEEIARGIAELPGVPHLRHMLAHVLPRQGKWKEAREALRASHLAHLAWAKELGVPPETDWHFGHNLGLLAAVEWRLGHTAEARRLYEEAVGLSVRGVYRGLALAGWLEFQLATGGHDVVLATQVRPEEGPFARLVLAGAQAQVHAAGGRGEAAQSARSRCLAARDEFRSALAKHPLQVMGPIISSAPLEMMNAVMALSDGVSATDRQQILTFADRYTQVRSIDAWSVGVRQLERLRNMSAGKEGAALREALERRIRQIDPAWRPVPASGP